MGRTGSSLLVRGGEVIDGSGAPRLRADVRVVDGMVAEVGSGLRRGVDEQVVDAAGAVVCPGFIDSHTHLDGSLWWDPASDPHPLHGVTTVVTGNCSLSLAPLRREHRDVVIDLFAFIEEIPNEALEQGIPWSWETWSEYRDAFNALGASLNVVPLLGHSNLRLYVMGGESFDRSASPAERDQLCAVLSEALEHGAFGLSLSFFDRDRSGRPVPSRQADDEEYQALAGVLAAHDASLMFIPGLSSTEETMRDVERVARFCGGHGVRATWAPLVAMKQNPAAALELLDHSRSLQALGVRMCPQVSTRSYDASINFDTTMMFFEMPLWNAVVQASRERKLRMLADSEWRAGARAEWDADRGVFFPTQDAGRARIMNVGPRGDGRLLGESFQSYVDARGVHASDALADLVLASDGELRLRIEGAYNTDRWAVSRLVTDDGALIGGGDAGAHVLTMCGTGDTTGLLVDARDNETMSLEHAVEKLTSQLGSFFGVGKRGRILPGWAADLVVFDPDELVLGPTYLVHDIPPGAAGRLTRGAGGYRYTIVDGTIVQEHGSMTTARPGRMLTHSQTRSEERSGAPVPRQEVDRRRDTSS